MKPKSRLAYLEMFDENAFTAKTKRETAINTYKMAMEDCGFSPNIQSKKGCGLIVNEIIITCGDEHGHLCDECSLNLKRGNNE